LSATEAKIKTPVPVTRGSNTGFFSQSIDWIEGTWKSGIPVTLPKSINQNWIETKAFNGYTVASLYADGRILMSNPNRPEMGVHTVWNGDACRQTVEPPLSLIKYLGAFGFSFTRIDLAIDLINCQVTPSQATEQIKNEQIKTRAQQFPFWADAKTEGYTQYIGKKTSEVYCRIYDKAAEMGIDQDHTRVELGIRHSRANFAAKTLVHHQDFRGLVLAYVNFPAWNEWVAAMDAPQIQLPSERKETNTRLWLLNACAPALAREIALEGGTDFYEKFKHAVMIRLQRERGKIQ